MLNAVFDRTVVLFIFCLACSGAASSNAEPVGYPVSVGDELALDFLDDGLDPHLLKVGARGDVQLPYIGSLEIEGLSLLEAREVIARAYVDNQIFLEPRLELSIMSMRQLSVLGDVRTPGFYEFRPFITVEQAVGLAGGPASIGQSEEDRSLQRASLSGQLAAQEIGLLKEIAAAQRLRAQLSGSDAIRIGPAAVSAGLRVDEARMEHLIAQEASIMMADREDFERQVAHLDRNIAETLAEIGFMDEQIEVQSASIASYGQELSISQNLTERGIQAEPVGARLRRQVAEDEYALLGLRANRVRTQRALAALEREKEVLDFARVQAWRVELSTRQAAIDQATAQRAAVLNQLQLLARWSTRMAQGSDAMSVDMFVRRRVGEAFEMIPAQPTDELWPGDTVLVQVSLTNPISDLPSN